MYVHLGNDISVRAGQIVGIFDIDYCSVDKRTREFLATAQKENRIVEVSPSELPRSFVVPSDGDGRRVYVTNVSPQTLGRRASAEEGSGRQAARSRNGRDL